MKIRDAQTVDAEATGAILHSFCQETDWMPKLHSAEEAVGFCRQMIDRGWVRVSETDGRITGFIAREDIDVNALYVASDMQGQGIGAALINEAKEASAKLRLWTFQDNLGARRFYADHGFVESARTDGQQTDEGLPDVQLLWEVGNHV